MATQFKRLEVHQEYTQLKTQPTSAESSSYLGNNHQKTSATLSSKIDHISFGPNKPYDIVVCSNTRAHIYGVDTFQQKKVFTRHNTPVTCADIRDDGQMVVTGTSAGIVQLCDMGSRSILRQFQDHKTAVRVTKFIGNGNKLLTCSDDHTVKIFDIASETIVHEITCHKDSVRAGIQSALSSDIIVTGGYDHSICFTDLRLPHGQQTVLRLDHGAPVTALVMFPNSGTIAAAGEQYINVYDMLSGPKQVAQFAHHQKAITGLAIDSLNHKLLSVGLDGYLRSYNMAAYTVSTKIEYQDPLLSIAMSPDSRVLAIGGVSGKLYFEKRHTEKEIAHIAKRDVLGTHMTQRQKHFFGGSGYKAKEDIDLNVEHERHRKLAPFDQRLKQFQHGAALDTAMASGNASVICALVDELILRGSINNALENRDDAALDPILRFILRYVSNPQYSSSVIKLAHAVLDVYTCAIGSSSLIDEVLLKLKTKLDGELSTQQDCLQLIGELDLFLFNSK